MISIGIDVHKKKCVATLKRDSKRIVEQTSLDLKNVLAIIGKGYALDNIGNHTKAVMYYNKAISIDSRYIADLTHKGNFLLV